MSDGVNKNGTCDRINSSCPRRCTVAQGNGRFTKSLIQIAHRHCAITYRLVFITTCNGAYTVRDIRVTDGDSTLAGCTVASADGNRRIAFGNRAVAYGDGIIATRVAIFAQSDRIFARRNSHAVLSLDTLDGGPWRRLGGRLDGCIDIGDLIADFAIKFGNLLFNIV